MTEHPDNQPERPDNHPEHPESNPGHSAHPEHPSQPHNPYEQPSNPGHEQYPGAGAQYPGYGSQYPGHGSGYPSGYAQYPGSYPGHSGGQQFSHPDSSELSGGLSERAEQQLRRGGWGCLVLVVVFILVVFFAWPSGEGDSRTFTDSQSDLYRDTGIYNGAAIPSFNKTDQRRLSDELAELQHTYDMCFGWVLKDGSTGSVQQGSSRGPGKRADSCDSWAEVHIVVAYTSQNSADYDAADISVATSPDLPEDTSDVRKTFAELGIDASTLIDDPVSATGHAVLALPLLLIQQGVLEPQERSSTADPESGPSAGNERLTDTGGSDFPVGTVVIIGLLGAGAVAAIVTGVVTTRKQKQQEP